MGVAAAAAWLCYDYNMSGRNALLYSLRGKLDIREKENSRVIYI